jgi:hypothetical protein
MLCPYYSHPYPCPYFCHYPYHCPSYPPSFDLLDAADVVLATLSGAGSRQLLDYVEGSPDAAG